MFAMFTYCYFNMELIIGFGTLELQYLDGIGSTSKCFQNSDTATYNC